MTAGDRDNLLGAQAADIILAAQGRFTRIWPSGPTYPNLAYGFQPRGRFDLSVSVARDPSLTRLVLDGTAVFSKKPHKELFRARLVGRKIVFEAIPSRDKS